MKAKKPAKSYVSRSVYQKVCEENKRLKADIYTMVMTGISGEAILTKQKWRDHFKTEAEFRRLLHLQAVQYIKDNPNSAAAQIAKEFEKEKQTTPNVNTKTNP